MLTPDITVYALLVILKNYLLLVIFEYLSHPWESKQNNQGTHHKDLRKLISVCSNPNTITIVMLVRPLYDAHFKAKKQR